MTIGGTIKVLGGEANRGGSIKMEDGRLTITDTATVTGGTSYGDVYSGSGCIHVANVTSIVFSGAPTMEEIRISKAGIMFDITDLTKDALHRWWSIHHEGRQRRCGTSLPQQPGYLCSKSPE